MQGNAVFRRAHGRGVELRDADDLVGVVADGDGDGNVAVQADGARSRIGAFWLEVARVVRHEQVRSPVVAEPYPHLVGGAGGVIGPLSVLADDLGHEHVSAERLGHNIPLGRCGKDTYIIA